MTTQIEGFKLSPQQRRICALQNGESNVRRSQCTVRIDGPLNVDALNAAVGRVAQRHEILRTAFPRIAGMTWPLQSIGESTDLQVTVAADGAAHVMTLSVPSLCADVLGLSTLVAEIAREYDGIAAGDEPMQYVV